MNDLAWAVPDGHKFGAAAYIGVERIYEDHMLTRHPRAMRHAIARQRATTCNGLLRLLLGTDVRDVFECMQSGQI